MLNRYTQVQVYREYTIEALKQALANIQSYDTNSAQVHIDDALHSIEKMRILSREENNHEKNHKTRII